jgi:hypothetical protein
MVLVSQPTRRKDIMSQRVFTLSEIAQRYVSESITVDEEALRAAGESTDFIVLVDDGAYPARRPDAHELEHLQAAASTAAGRQLVAEIRARCCGGI